MGEPIFEPEKIPVDISSEFKVQSEIPPLNPPLAMGGRGGVNSTLKSQISNLIIDYPLQIADKEIKITCVSMGNPHAIIVVDDVDSFPVTYYGPMIEKHSLFPKKTNVEFIEVSAGDEIRMRVWERGSGGMHGASVAVASNIKGAATEMLQFSFGGSSDRVG
jgi:diaminopimelate epimerase